MDEGMKIGLLHQLQNGNLIIVVLIDVPLRKSVHRYLVMSDLEKRLNLPL